METSREDIRKKDFQYQTENPEVGGFYSLLLIYDVLARFLPSNYAIIHI
ncbi:hypothetical protein [Treponema sp.]|nr:hypothetical protein [Treponema sp.]MCQ2240240.1 hypothetical protein [Treponema sp.]